MSEFLSSERKAEIIDQYLKREANRTKSTQAQRQVWNRNYYQSKGRSPETKQRAREKYLAHSQMCKDKAKVNYYKRGDRLHILKTKYPDIYSRYVK